MERSGIRESKRCEPFSRISLALHAGYVLCISWSMHRILGQGRLS
jgi:hypothetical protein